MGQPHAQVSHQLDCQLLIKDIALLDEILRAELVRELKDHVAAFHPLSGGEGRRPIYEGRPSPPLVVPIVKYHLVVGELLPTEVVQAASQKVDEDTDGLVKVYDHMLGHVD